MTWHAQMREDKDFCVCSCSQRQCSSRAHLCALILLKRYPVVQSLTKMYCFVQPTTEQLCLTLMFNIIPLAVQHMRKTKVNLCKGYSQKEGVDYQSGGALFKWASTLPKEEAKIWMACWIPCFWTMAAHRKDVLMLVDRYSRYPSVCAQALKLWVSLILFKECIELRRWEWVHLKVHVTKYASTMFFIILLTATRWRQSFHTADSKQM